MFFDPSFTSLDSPQGCVLSSLLCIMDDCRISHRDYHLFEVRGCLLSSASLHHSLLTLA